MVAKLEVTSADYGLAIYRKLNRSLRVSGSFSRIGVGFGGAVTSTSSFSRTHVRAAARSAKARWTCARAGVPARQAKFFATLSENSACPRWFWS